MPNNPPSNHTADILIVDDQPENLRLLSKVLTRRGYEVRPALSGAIALQAVKTRLPDLIMLDIMMPQMDGYEVCSRLKAEPETAQIPIIFLSALDDVFDKVRAFSVGGVDYITKPFQSPEVIARVQHQLALKAINQQISELNEHLEKRVQERTQQLQETNVQLRTMAFHDHLTGLPNRVLLMEHLEIALQQAQADPNYQFAVLFLDCDRFKVVNDSLGHSIGDQLLACVARRLATALPQVDILSRLGGDEFAILLTDIQQAEDAIQVAETIVAALSKPFKLQQFDVYINGSIGIAIGSGNYTQPEHILRDADAAMYRAKAQGYPRYQVFDPKMYQEALQFLQIETEIRKAIVDCTEYQVYYQPIIDIKTGKLMGFETLARWFHPTKGFISPAEFIPVAEETGLIVPLGFWILEQACQQLGTWQEQGLVDDQLSVNVNLSARQFSQPELISNIDKVLGQIPLASKNLKLEITESALMDNQKKAQNILQQLRDRQIQLCLDDFGTGYSSLSYLHSFPVNTLKIDKSFISRLDGTLNSLGLIPVIINIAQKMEMTVVAEGIETLEQLKQLQSLDCDFGQGYLFSKPIPSQEATKLLQSSTIVWCDTLEHQINPLEIYG